MLTAISSYLFGEGEATDESTIVADAISESDDVIEDWIFVDHANLTGKLQIKCNSKVKTKTVD